MKIQLTATGAALASLVVGLAAAPTEFALGQQAAEVEEIVVTGSRIRRNPLDEAAAVMELGDQELERAGLTNLGDTLRQLPISGSAVNSQFNVPGNSGFPQDGAGIGAGAVQLSIRNLGAKRTLVLVDGRRWVAGASASGVPGVVDLNTIPDNVIERIEILQDGASAIYGSDAIGGVVNIITKQNFEGFRLDLQTGGYLSEGDGESSEISALWGAGNDTTHLTVSASYKDEKGIDTWDRARSAYPNPDATSCNIPGTLCSSNTPQARFILGPDFNFWDATLNDGVLNDGMTNIPVFDPNDPNGGDFHAWSSADRFNYNGPGLNYLRTPNERVNLYADATHDFTDQVHLFAKFSYTNRSSATKAAPEPLQLGNGSGNAFTDAVVISQLNPYNPFGDDLSVANGNLEFFGRRPLESGGRLFFQDVNSYMGTIGLQGDFEAAGRGFYWDVYASYGDNRGFQEKHNSHNAAKIVVALGDPAVCTATPNCVPLNYFGGQGPDGNGSITDEMLDFIRYTQRDFSEQTLENYAFNIGGDIFEYGAGTMAFAAGIEYRDHNGSYRPDDIAARGETAGIPAGATAGGFDVTEYYAELSIPLLADVTLADLLEVNVAARNSDYSTSGSNSTYKVSGLWRPIDQLSFRGSFSTGLRAPGIGELFGGAAREDFTKLDPCADYTGIIGSTNGGRDAAQPANIQANCQTLGVNPGLAQTNPQLSAVSAGNVNLTPEESDSYTVGFVYSPAWSEGLSWSDGMTLTLDFYNIQIDNAIQGRDPGDLIDACVLSLDPTLCASVPRTSTGQVDLVDNPIANIGTVDAAGMDLMFSYATPETRAGSFVLGVNATYLQEYKQTTTSPDGSQIVKDLKGVHTDETFQRAFPEWRAVTTIDWFRERFSGSLAFRWVDAMTLDDGSPMDSVTFTDIRASYNPGFAGEAITVTLGVNNVFDTTPPVCFPCGVIGLSTVSHDLPGRVGYVRFSWQPK